MYWLIIIFSEIKSWQIEVAVSKGCKRDLSRSRRDKTFEILFQMRPFQFPPRRDRDKIRSWDQDVKTETLSLIGSGPKWAFSKYKVI